MTPKRERRPGQGAARTATALPPATIHRATVNRPRKRGSKQRDAETCRVSLLPPGYRRKQYHYLARCPVCGAPHLGRARELTDVTVTRRLPCKHWVVIVVARVYSAGTAA